MMNKIIKKETKNEKQKRNEKERTSVTSVYEDGYFLSKPLISVKEFNRKQIRKENLRWVVTNLNYQAIQATAVMVNFTLPTTYGNQNGSRTGDSVHLEGLDIYALFNYESLVVISPSTVRAIIIQSIAENDTFSAAEILENGGSGALDVASQIQPLANGHLFNVLYDKIFHLNAYGANGQVFERIKLDLPIKNINFAQGSANLQSGGFVQMLLISDSAAAPHPSILMSARTWYTSV